MEIKIDGGIWKGRQPGERVQARIYIDPDRLGSLISRAVRNRRKRATALGGAVWVEVTPPPPGRATGDAKQL